MSEYLQHSAVTEGHLWRLQVYRIFDDDTGEVVVTGYRILATPHEDPLDVEERHVEADLLHYQVHFTPEEVLGVGYLAMGAEYFTEAVREQARQAAVELLRTTEVAQWAQLDETRWMLAACGAMPFLPPLNLETAP